MERIEALTIIKQWNKDHRHRDGSDSLFVERLRPFLGEEQIAQVLSVMGEVCNLCWENEEPCYCAPEYDE